MKAFAEKSRSGRNRAAIYSFNSGQDDGIQRNPMGMSPHSTRNYKRGYRSGCDIRAIRLGDVSSLSYDELIEECNEGEMK